MVRKSNGGGLLLEMNGFVWTVLQNSLNVGRNAFIDLEGSYVKKKKIIIRK